MVVYLLGKNIQPRVTFVLLTTMHRMISGDETKARSLL